MGLWHTNGSLNLGQKTGLYNNQQKKKKKKKKKENLQDCELCRPGWLQNKIEESEKKDKSLDLSRDLKKLWNMKVKIIPIMIGAFGTVTEGL